MKLLEYLDEKENELVNLTKDLVKIKSISKNEENIRQFIVDFLEKQNVKTKIEKGNILAETGEGEEIIFSGHFDTVPFEKDKWDFGPLSGKIEDGKLYGRGAHDMKGGLACLIFAFLALKNSEFGGKVKLVLTWGEEIGNKGIKEFLKNETDTKAVILGEPSPPTHIEIGSRGLLRLKIKTKGKTAHTGSLSQTGINAVTKMAKLLLKLEDLEFKYKKHDLFPPPRISPGTIINGGTAINIVPSECKAKVDCRLSFGQTKKSSLEDINKVIKGIQNDDKDFKVEVNPKTYIPPTLTSQNEKIVKASKKAREEILGQEQEFKVSGGVTDGARLVEKGVPTVFFGPTGDNYHSENEYVLVDSLLKTAKAYALSVYYFFSD